MEESKHDSALRAQVDKKELPLTTEEQNIDFRKQGVMLNLGEHKNYKTKLVQKRWEIERQQWLADVNKSKEDQRMGIPAKPFPSGNTTSHEYMMPKMEKRTMKSVSSPYEPFQGFYPLSDCIDAYMEIWYKDDSSDSSY